MALFMASVSGESPTTSYPSHPYDEADWPSTTTTPAPVAAAAAADYGSGHDPYANSGDGMGECTFRLLAFRNGSDSFRTSFNNVMC